MAWCSCGGEVHPGGKAPQGGGECLRCERVYPDTAALHAAGGTIARLCGVRARAERCSVSGCKGKVVALCDAPGTGRRTCDRRLCEEHRARVGQNRDHCPEHAGQQTLGLEAPLGGAGHK